jgi:hypothetical protein
MRLQEQKLRLTGLNQETRYSGKLARNLGLKAVAHDKVVFITPDTNTPDPHWLPGIATALSGGKEIAVGYTRLSGAKGFYHRLYRTESFFQQTESMAFCINGIPFISPEENITFDRKAYFAINGFAGRIGEEYLNMELIFNQIIRKNNNAVLPAGNLSLERDMVAGKQDFRELYYKSFILNGYLSFKIRSIRWLVNWLRALLLPFLVVCTVLFTPVWPLFAVMFLTLIIIRLIYLKRLLNRLNETGIFVISFLYGMTTPYLRIFRYWQFRNKRKNS